MIFKLVQTYSLRMLLVFEQRYGDSPEMYAKLDQYYWDAYIVIKGLAQSYGDVKDLFVKLEQKWEGPELLFNALAQFYTLTNEPLSKKFAQFYNLDDLNKHTAALIQSYPLVTGEPLLIPSNVISIGGNPTTVKNVQIEYHDNSYSGLCSITLMSRAQWNNLDYGQSVRVIHGIDIYDFVIIDFNKSETATKKAYTITARSKAVLMDFPFASKIDDNDMVYGKSSEITERIAQTKGQSVIWEMNSDPAQTELTYPISGKSPLGAIRDLVNQLGGTLQSDPDGTLRANPWYKHDTDKLENVVANITLSSSADYSSVSSDNSKRDGFNVYEILNEDSAGGWRLVTDSITSNHYKATAIKDPWDTTALSLRTSELTNVNITYNGVVTEVVKDELVELKEGVGTTEYFIQDITGFTYPSRINLGDITFTSAGVITAAMKEESMVNITYTRKFHDWTVRGTDSEKIQLILENK